MLTTAEIRERLQLPRNTKTRQVLNRAIRECVPGGGDLLDRLEKLDYARVQLNNDPQFAAEVGKLRAERDRLANGLRQGTIPVRRLRDIKSSAAPSLR